jgi:hypothetical protein
MAATAAAGAALDGAADNALRCSRGSFFLLQESHAPPQAHLRWMVGCRAVSFTNVLPAFTRRSFP